MSFVENLFSKYVHLNMAHILSCPSFSTCMSIFSPHPFPSPPLSSLPLLSPPFLLSPVSPYLHPFLTRNMDLFPELVLDDKDGDDGSIPKVYTMALCVFYVYNSPGF